MDRPDTTPVELLKDILPTATEHCNDHIKDWVEQFGRALVAHGQSTGELEVQALREWLYRVRVNLSWEGAELLQDALDTLGRNNNDAGSHPLRP